MEVRVLELLIHLHKFNRLDKRTVLAISSIFDIDAIRLCRAEGITYTV